MSKSYYDMSSEGCTPNTGGGSLIDFNADQASKPLTCLGIGFENDAQRRFYFLKELEKKLNDPRFCAVEGFPVGNHETILELSDPPYYTACPNPWLSDFINEWENQKSDYTVDNNYHREPFALDILEKKSGHIYKAHSYHTKVPHKAIMRFILHYTNPNDIVFDGFCGTGMTGVAAQLCADPDAVRSLGYQVSNDGTILHEVLDEDGKKMWKPFSKLGARKAILNDLSPIATYIADNYSNAHRCQNFQNESVEFIEKLKEKWEKLYQTKHSSGNDIGIINFVVWSDVFNCPDCSNEFVFYNDAFDQTKNKIHKEFNCPNCDSQLTKRKVDRAVETIFDNVLKRRVTKSKQTPVLIDYTFQGKRFKKVPDKHDFEKLESIEKDISKRNFKSIPMMHKGGEKWGAVWRAGYHLGVTHVHQFYTPRNFLILMDAWETAPSREIRWAISAILNYINKKQTYSGGGGGMPGVHFLASLIKEQNFMQVLERKLKSISKSFQEFSKVKDRSVISSQSTSDFSNSISSNSIDYIFIDPPFGSNIMYSEGSFLWESMLSLWTNQNYEAIESDYHEKSNADYRKVMTSCFAECHRILKPGRWISIEFSNTKASVWNSIQTALADSGFVVANVSLLDKKQGGFKSVTTPTAVMQDLIITAYKIDESLEKKIVSADDMEQSVWEFVSVHLSNLPVTKNRELDVVAIPEREPRRIFDQVVSFFVRRGLNVPMDSTEFQRKLQDQNFEEQDGMYFLSEQISEYRFMKTINNNRLNQQSLFIVDEVSAIEWLRNLLTDNPMSYQDIQPKFMQENLNWKNNEEMIELNILLDQNFIEYNGKGPIPKQICDFLIKKHCDLGDLTKDDPKLIANAKNLWYVPDPNEALDKEKLREKHFIKKFEFYVSSKGKIKSPRIEVIRAGFRKAWQDKDYATIMSVAEKLDVDIIEDDPLLLMWYDQSKTRTKESEL